MNSIPLPKKKKTEQMQIKPKLQKIMKSNIEDVYPMDIPNIELVSPEIKQYVNELEREYLERYNVLQNNRRKYE
jgi:hypothetical protein